MTDEQFETIKSLLNNVSSATSLLWATVLCFVVVVLLNIFFKWLKKTIDAKKAKKAIEKKDEKNSKW